MKHLFEGQCKQTSAVLSGRPAAKAQLIIHIKAETVGLALFHSLGSIAHIMHQKDVSQRFFWAVALKNMVNHTIIADYLVITVYHTTDSRM